MSNRALKAYGAFGALVLLALNASFLCSILCGRSLIVLRVTGWNRVPVWIKH